jgi:hypothetical protein
VFFQCGRIIWRRIREKARHCIRIPVHRIILLWNGPQNLGCSRRLGVGVRLSLQVLVLYRLSPELSVLSLYRSECRFRRLGPVLYVLYVCSVLDVLHVGLSTDRTAVELNTTEYLVKVYTNSMLIIFDLPLIPSHLFSVAAIHRPCA